MFRWRKGFTDGSNILLQIPRILKYIQNIITFLKIKRERERETEREREYFKRITKIGKLCVVVVTHWSH